MAGFGKILGGALKGVGAGLIEQAKADREMALLALQQEHRLRAVEHGEGLRRESERLSDTRRDESAAQQFERARTASAEADERDYRQALDLEGVRHGHDLSKLGVQHGYSMAESAASAARSRADDPLIEVMDDKGRPVWAKRSEAAGRPVGRSSKGTGFGSLGMPEADKRLVDSVVKANTSMVPNDLEESTNWSGVVDTLIAQGRTDLARAYAGNLRAQAAQIRERGAVDPRIRGATAASAAQEPVAQEPVARARGAPAPAATSQRPPPPAEYPDARWNDKVGGYVVQRDGRWFKVMA